jgi:hypothetical protein
VRTTAAHGWAGRPTEAAQAQYGDGLPLAEAQDAAASFHAKGLVARPITVHGVRPDAAVIVRTAGWSVLNDRWAR